MHATTRLPRSTALQRVAMMAGLLFGIAFVALGVTTLVRSGWLDRFGGAPSLPSYARPAGSVRLGGRFESCDNQDDWSRKGGNVAYFGTQLSFEAATSPTITELERRGWRVRRGQVDPDDSFFAHRDSISIHFRRVKPDGVWLSKPVDTSAYVTVILTYVVNTDQCTG